jgi:hypothetical protein
MKQVALFNALEEHAGLVRSKNADEIIKELETHWEQVKRANGLYTIDAHKMIQFNPVVMAALIQNAMSVTVNNYSANTGDRAAMIRHSIRVAAAINELVKKSADLNLISEEMQAANPEGPF